MHNRKFSLVRVRWLLGTLFLAVPMMSSVFADETCLSPYMKKITGQEDYVYVWTLGKEGVGDGQDKLVTVAVNPNSEDYGKVVNSLSVEGRNEAHHSGLTDDRRFLWAGALDTNKIFIFDISSDPRKPGLKKVINDFVEKSGGMVGPHTFYAFPGKMMISALSNDKDHHGRTGLVEYSNEGEFVAAHWLPTTKYLRGATQSGKFADGYGYDIRVLPRKGIMLTSSFTGYDNYMTALPELLKNPEAMARFGNTMVLWDLHTRKPRKVLDVPGAPLEIRCAWGALNNYCFTTSALTSKMWVVYQDEKSGRWKAKVTATIGDVGNKEKFPLGTALPVDISITANDKGLWVQTFLDGKTRYFDISDPFNARQVYEHVIGAQVNMVSQSWDGRRMYFTSSLLSNWDKTGEDDEQFLKGYAWDGKELKERFAIDFYKEKLGRPHQMRFGAYSLYELTKKQKEGGKLKVSAAR